MSALVTLIVFTIAWDAYCAELRLEARVQRLEERVSAVEKLQPGGSMTKIPEYGDLSAIEQAVWAAEYVRVRAVHLHYDENDRVGPHRSRPPARRSRRASLRRAG